MMNGKGTYVVLSYLLVSVWCASALGDRNSRQLRGSIRYQYNHPPEFEPIPVAVVYDDRGSKKLETKPVSTTETIKTKTDKTTKTSRVPFVQENYAAVPVAVVYEETNYRETKKLERKPVSTTEIITQKTKKTTKENIITTFKNDFEDIKVTTWRPPSNQINNETRATSYKRIYPDKEIQIPVEVIYDDEDDIRLQYISKNRKSLKKGIRSQKEYKDISFYRKSTEKPVETTTTVPTKALPEVTKKQTEPKKPIKPVDAISQVQEKRPLVTLRNQVTQQQPLDVTTTTTTTAPKGGKRREKDPVVPIVESENHVYAHNGGFQYSYEGGDGTKSFQTGELKEIDGERTGESVSGGYSYTDKNGKGFSLTYTADENGYRPVGEHLPTPPPIPPAIARALLYLATKPTEHPDEDTTKAIYKE